MDFSLEKRTHWNAEEVVNTVIPRLQKQHLWLLRALVLCFSWLPPNLREAYEVITKVKSYCATETDARGGKKSWQKFSGVSLERFCKWEETEQIGEKGLREELAEVEAEEGLKWWRRESAWNKEIQKREKRKVISRRYKSHSGGGERVAVLM